MEGKIFTESSNIYQDQAKILFNYYKAAAEKVVAQELTLEEKIKETKVQIARSSSDKNKLITKKNIAFVLFFAIIIGLISGIILYFKINTPYIALVFFFAIGVLIYGIIMLNSKIKELTAYIESKHKEIKDLKVEHKNIFRDYKVEKLGVAYIPVASRVAFNDKSFLVDHTGSAKDEKFTLQILRQNKLINSTINELRNLTQKAPIVEESNHIEKIETCGYSRSIQSVNFHDYFGKLDRSLRTISYCLSDMDETVVKLPVIYPESSYAKFLIDHATNNTGHSPVFTIFNTKQHDEQISGFKELNETRKSISSDSEEVDQTLRHLMVDMALSVQKTSEMKVSSAGSLIDYSNRTFFNILKSSYNFYSPILEADEINRIKNESFNYGEIDVDYKPFDLRDSSRMHFDLTSMCWVDENGGRSISPFGVNQIQSEIMAPIVTNLLKETSKDRAEVYNHIKDQKIDYLNQWHRDTEDFYGRNRAEASDLINLMRANLSDYTAAYNTLIAFQKTEDNMRNNASLESAITEAHDNSAEVLMAYQQQSDQFKLAQSDFADYMERLHDDIDLKAAKFGHVEYYDASLRDSKSKDMAIAVDNVSSLDERRKPLAEVNPLLAQNSDLPPAPSVDDLTYEHIGLNLISLAQEAIENLNAIADETIFHKDELEKINTEDITIEDQFDQDYPVLEKDNNEIVDNDIITDENQEDGVDDNNIENDDAENKQFEVGMEVYNLDEEGNKVYYDDGEYPDEEHNAIIVLLNGKISEIRKIDEGGNNDEEA